MGFLLRYAAHLGIRGTQAPLFMHSVGSLDPVEHIAFAASRGFAGMQDNFFLTRPAEEQGLIGQALQAHGLELGCVCLGAPGDLVWGRGDPESASAIDAQLAAAIAAISRAGGKYLVIAPGRDLREVPAIQMAALVRHLRRLAPMAERSGVTLCLEMTSEPRVPGQLLHHIAEAYLVSCAVESDAVRLLLDLFHVQMMDGQLLHKLEQVWDQVAIIQISDCPDRTELGLGEVNWPRVLRAIHERGYKGLVEYEIFPSRPGIAGEEAALEALVVADGVAGSQV